MWNKTLGAIENSDAQMVSFFLNQEPNLVFEQNYQNETLLHFAAQQKSINTVLTLLSHGARADVADEFGWTPLHDACNSDNELAVEAFIRSGINVNIRTRKQETALHIATRRKHAKIMARLIEAGANKNAVNKDGNTPLHLAAQKGLEEPAKILIAAGPNLNAQNLEGYTPLHLAAIKGCIKSAEILIRANADVNKKDAHGRDFLELAGIYTRTIFITRMKMLLDELSQTEEDDAQHTVPTLQELVAPEEPTQPDLQQYFNELESTLPAENQQPEVQIMVCGFIFDGLPGSTFNLALKTIESILWFLIFPLLLFIMWQGFLNDVFPAIISIEPNLQNYSYVEFLEAAINSIIVFLGSTFLVVTESNSSSLLYLFKDLRESVHFRVLHLFLIEMYFFNRLAFNQTFWNNFVAFWLWFIALYALSYILWWVDIHSKPQESKDKFLYEGN
jgi:ankyrin repeat protein